jgi:hypothetical protein
MPDRASKAAVTRIARQLCIPDAHFQDRRAREQANGLDPFYCFGADDDPTLEIS